MRKIKKVEVINHIRIAQDKRGFSIIHEMEVMFLNLDILLEVSN